jgi:hypothetical protein
MHSKEGINVDQAVSIYPEFEVRFSSICRVVYALIFKLTYETKPFYY